MGFQAAVTAAVLPAWPAVADPLPSRNDTEAKAAISDVVTAVTDPASDDFEPARDRIAVVDNDGMLRSEKPVPFPELCEDRRPFAFNGTIEAVEVTQ